MKTAFKSIFRHQAAGGLVLLAATAAAILWANCLTDVHAYHSFWESPLFGLTLHQWINDVLMGVFFYFVGLEIKREVLEGELSSLKKAMLPIAGALGGMLAPILIFALWNKGSTSMRGWAIPMATDIAFALGVVSLLGKRVPTALKVFLVALAIVDDLGAVLVITFAFPSQGHYTTVFAVLMAVLTPMKAGKKLERFLQPWVAFAIMPVFALANAGVDISPTELSPSAKNLAFGVVAGLLIGKPLGITLFSWLAVRLKLAALPGGTQWSQLFAVSILGGIGFTMSIFIGGLSFGSGVEADVAKLAILLASSLAALGGTIAVCVRAKR